MKAVVIVFPGSNCDRDGVVGLQKAGFKVQSVWHGENSLPQNIDLIFIPGGFSYGDYLRSGAMSAISPIMNEVKKLAKKGVKILGVCNGFQILTEASLLDGVLLKNEKARFICKMVNLKVENSDTIFTNKYQNSQIIKIPVAHMDGCYFANNDVIKKIEDNNQIAFRYCNESGHVNGEANINGSINNIAGIFNKEKNILGMMPHPERAIENDLGSDDGIKVFESILNKF